MDIPPINSDDIAELSMAGQTFGKAELLCRLAVYSYLNPSELATVMAKAPWTDYEYWDFGENQGFVAWSPHCAVVSFRGTDSVNDWGQNAKVLWPRPHELGGRVHRGFREVSNQAKQRVVEILSSLDAADRHLWLTGHSLGGAVATEFSAHLLVQPIRSLPNWEVTTFGAPRLGDEGFENAYESRIGAGHCESHWWFVNEGDPVPHLPPKFFGYLHCGRLFWFDKTGKLIPVDEREVGLQAAKAGENAEAMDHWFALEESIPDVQNEEEYALFLKSLEEAMGDPIAGLRHDPETGNVFFPDQKVQLQGALGEWIADDHKLNLYWSRIRNLV